METTITESTTSIAGDKASIETYAKNRDRETIKLTTEQDTLVLVETYLHEHEQDRALVTELTGLSEQIQTLSSPDRRMLINRKS